MVKESNENWKGKTPSRLYKKDDNSFYSSANLSLPVENRTKIYFGIVSLSAHVLYQFNILATLHRVGGHGDYRLRTGGGRSITSGGSAIGGMSEMVWCGGGRWVGRSLDCQRGTADAYSTDVSADWTKPPNRWLNFNIFSPLGSELQHSLLKILMKIVRNSTEHSIPGCHGHWKSIFSRKYPNILY